MLASDAMVHQLRTIDAHAAGQSLRLVVGGLPTPRGSSMLARQTSMVRQADHLRRALMLEPRGHAGMAGALLTEPVSEGAHAGVLFMHGAGFSPFCGHGLMAVATIALERGLITMRSGGTGAEQTLQFDTVSGPVAVRAQVQDEDGVRRVTGVTLVCGPACVTRAGVPVRVALRDGMREARVDVAFAGGYYAMVDGESLGVALMPDAVPELRRAAATIVEALDGTDALMHPQHPGPGVLEGVVFTGPPGSDDAHLRSVTVFGDGAVDRSPCGGSTAAVMAVLSAMELLPPGEPFVHESLIGTRFVGRVAGLTRVGDLPAIRPEVDGVAWITGEHTFLVDEADPLREGFHFPAPPERAGRKAREVSARRTASARRR